MNTELIYNNSDTICAVITPSGTGGVAVVRVSGRNAFKIVDSLWHGKSITKMASHTAHLGEITDKPGGKVLDQAVVTVFHGPASFTGENVVEIGIHGSRWIQRQVITALSEQGARPALPGEFTRRAFLAGKLDLAEAEAMADVIASSSAASHRIAMNQLRGGYSKFLGEIRRQLVDLTSLLELELDFSEEDVEFASRVKLRSLAENAASSLRKLADSFKTGAAIKNGIPVAIIGKTNVGKSSLLNALLGDERAIVSDIHGTTRDIVEDTTEIGPYLVRFKDTAGFRKSDDPIENMGIDRSLRAADSAEIVLLVIDATNPEWSADSIENLDSERVIIVINKIDLCNCSNLAPSELTRALPYSTTLPISAKTGLGIDKIRNEIVDRLDSLTNNSSEADTLVSNARQAQAMSAAAASLQAVVEGLDSGLPPDLIAQDLREGLHHLSTITGEITTPEILQTIFSRFCIGK